MKFFISLLLTALLGYAAPLFLPWWSFALTSFIVAFVVPQPPGKAFLSGFLGLFLLWSIYALLLDNANHHVLSEKIAQVLLLPSPYWLLIIISGLIGALISGFAACTASFAIAKPHTENNIAA